MRILILQFASAVAGQPVPRFEPQLGVLLSLLKQRGHELSLLGLSRFDVGAVKDALAAALPQLIYADVSSVCIDVAQRTLQYVTQHEFLPIVAGGSFATVDPSNCLSLPGVQAVAIGEPDASLVTYFERIKDPAVVHVVQGVWLRDERGLKRPELPGLVEDLDSLPFPERELFNYAAFVEHTHQIEIAVGRGCPQRCGYCRNPVVERLYEDRGAWVRRRSSENILEEIAALRESYAQARLVRFLDHAFALDREWLTAFLAAYRPRCDLPFRCHLRANSVDNSLCSELSDAGCKLADVEIISGSDFVRNEIFSMDLTGAEIAATFDQLRAAGLRSRAIVYVGAPYESEASIDETLELLRRLRPDIVDARPYFPFPATDGAQTSQENGWIHSRGQEQYHQDQSGINMPACRPDLVASYLKRLRREFVTDLSEPWWRRWSDASRSAFVQLFQKRK